MRHAFSERRKGEGNGILGRGGRKGPRFLTMPAGGMCMSPQLFLWLTITGRCWVGLLKLHSSEVSGVLRVWCAQNSGKNYFSAKVVLPCSRREDSASRTETLWGIFPGKESQKPFLDCGGLGCCIISLFRIAHSPAPSPWLSKANTRETLIYLFPSMNHITIKAQEASVNQSGKERTMEKLRNFFKDESGASAVEYGLLVSLIAVVIITSVNTLGTNLSSKFHQVATAIGS